MQLFDLDDWSVLALYDYGGSDDRLKAVREIVRRFKERVNYVSKENVEKAFASNVHENSDADES